MPYKDREAAKRHRRTYYLKHKEILLAQKKNYYQNNKEWINHRKKEIYRKSHSKKQRRKYLKPEDISTELASCLDFNSQSILRKGLHITRTCTICGKKQAISVSTFRHGRVGSRCHSCRLRSQTGINNPTWKGGRFIDKQGYVQIRVPTHPYAVHGYVFEHRLVMEKMIGRYLKREETVHHINGDRQDNRPENLELRTSAHGPGVRISDLRRHCWTCRCAKKMKAIPTITLDFFMTTVSTGTVSATIA